MLNKVDRNKNTRRIICPECQGHQRILGSAVDRCDYCNNTGVIYVDAVNPQSTLGPWHLSESSERPGFWALKGPWNTTVAKSGSELSMDNPAESLKNGRLLHQAPNLYAAMKEVVERGLISHEDGVLFDNIIRYLGQIETPICNVACEESFDFMSQEVAA